MIANLFFSFVFMAIGSALLPREKYSRIASTILFSLCGILLIATYLSQASGIEQTNIWNLLNYPQLKINFNLSSTAETYSIITPTLLLLCLSLLFNIFEKIEEARARLGGLMLLGFAFLIALICSNNLLIMLVASSLCGIVGIFIINDYDSKKNYVFYNLIADMALLTAIIIVYSSSKNINLNFINAENLKSEYKNLISSLLLLGIGIKSGLFLFHKQTLCFDELSFNRILFLSFGGTPICGVILFVKLIPLLQISVFEPLILCWAVCTILYGFVGSLTYDSIKEKALSINMILWGSIIFAATKNAYFSIQSVTSIIVLFYLFNWWLGLIVLACSGEIYISRLSGLWKKLWLLLIWVSILALALFVSIYNLAQTNQYWAILLPILLISFTYIIRQLFFDEMICDEMVAAFLRIPPFILWALPLVPIMLILSICHINLLIPCIIWVVSFVGLIWLYPLRFIAKVYDNETLQASDFFNQLYDIAILTPLNVIGRILWLTVDFLLIERTILNSISKATNGLIKISQKIHSHNMWVYILMLLCGLLILLGFLGG